MAFVFFFLEFILQHAKQLLEWIIIVGWLRVDRWLIVVLIRGELRIVILCRRFCGGLSRLIRFGVLAGYRRGDGSIESCHSSASTRHKCEGRATQSAGAALWSRNYRGSGHVHAETRTHHRVAVATAATGHLQLSWLSR